MAAKKKVTVSMSPVARRPSSAERRAEQSAVLDGKQAQLKREAAERREKRAAAPARDRPA
jgi:septal ring factor EnvC (AmiA/AmiB activator)